MAIEIVSFRVFPLKMLDLSIAMSTFTRPGQSSGFFQIFPDFSIILRCARDFPRDFPWFFLCEMTRASSPATGGAQWVAHRERLNLPERRLHLGEAAEFAAGTESPTEGGRVYPKQWGKLYGWNYIETKRVPNLW